MTEVLISQAWEKENFEIIRKKGELKAGDSLRGFWAHGALQVYNQDENFITHQGQEMWLQKIEELSFCLPWGDTQTPSFSPSLCHWLSHPGPQKAVETGSSTSAQGSGGAHEVKAWGFASFPFFLETVILTMLVWIVSLYSVVQKYRWLQYKPINPRRSWQKQREDHSIGRLATSGYKMSS